LELIEQLIRIPCGAVRESACEGILPGIVRQGLCFLE
jgi:hypothetical protein